MKLADQIGRSMHRNVQPKLKVAFAVLLLVSTGLGATQRSVVELTIRETGASEHADTVEMCSRFKPTKAQLKRYLLRAYPVEGVLVVHDRYSPCYATGTIRFSDNSMGTWRLRSAGTAGVGWSRGGGAYLLHKYGNGWRDPFACSYGLGDVGEC